jgi:hypothetical protein
MEPPLGQLTFVGTLRKDITMKPGINDIWLGVVS